jgi:hypothetical protein
MLRVRGACHVQRAEGETRDGATMSITFPDSPLKHEADRLGFQLNEEGDDYLIVRCRWCQREFVFPQRGATLVSVIDFMEYHLQVYHEARPRDAT